MFLIFFFILASLLLILILNVVSHLVSERAVLIREELSAYECGFEHHNVSRIPFSLRYFTITLLFLLFDLEIVFLLFLPLLCNSSVSSFIILVSFLFVCFLYLTLIYEWTDGTLEWLVFVSKS